MLLLVFLLSFLSADAFLGFFGSMHYHGDHIRNLYSRNSNAKLHDTGVMKGGNSSPCMIKVIGVGGGGGNAVQRMIDTGVTGVQFTVINTDAQALSRFQGTAGVLPIGRDVTRGLGAGGIPDNGRKAAEESRKELATLLQGADLVFVTAGMGGGTGSGAAPVIAEVAKECGALTVGIVTTPFGFEGRKRMQQATESINNLRKAVDTLIVVSNDRLLQIIPENIPVKQAFLVADDTLRQGVVGVSEIIIRPGLINVDFADVRAVMGDAGSALMGIGKGNGKNRAQDAAAAALSSPLLDFPIKKAQGVVFNVVGGSDLTLQEINSAAEVIYEAVDSNANIIFGALIDESMTGDVSVTVIATGFPGQGKVPSTRKILDEDDEMGRELGSFQVDEADNDAKQKRRKVQEKRTSENDLPSFLNKLRRR